MRILLDTHTLLWWLDDHPTLSIEARETIRTAENRVFVSAASAWEIVIKKKLGKLRTPSRLDRELEAHRFEPLPVTLEHALTVGKLRDHHQDPFDRMLVAQAMVEGLPIVTRDENIQKYGVAVIRA